MLEEPVALICSQLVIVVENLETACLLSDLQLNTTRTLGHQDFPKLAAGIHARSFAC